MLWIFKQRRFPLVGMEPEPFYFNCRSCFLDARQIFLMFLGVFERGGFTYVYIIHALKKIVLAVLCKLGKQAICQKGEVHV